MDDPADPTGTVAAGRADAVSPVLAAVCLFGILVPLVVALVTRWGSPYLPIQDLAVFDLRLRDLPTRQSPLVGVYSQFGWNHPGPAAYWLVAPFVALSGGAAWGMIVASAVLHAIAMFLAVWIAWRTSGPMWATFWAAVFAACYAAVGPWMVLEAWNPHIAFPLFTLFLVLAWRGVVAPGSFTPWIVVVGSLLVQIHIGYVPLVGMIGVWVALVYLRALRSGEDVVDWRPVVRWSAVAVALLWAAPAFEALTNRGGNVRALSSYFLLGSGEEERAGVTTALELVAAQFAVPPPWLGGSGDLDSATGLAAGASLWWSLIVVGFVAAGVLVRRRCGLDNRRLIELSWVLLVAGVFSLAALRGKVAPYLFYWRITLAVLLVAAVAAGLWSLSAVSGVRQARLAVQGALTVFVLFTSSGFAASLWNAPDHVVRFEPATAQLLEQIGPLPGPVIVRWAGSPLGGVQAGIVNELARRGEPVGVDVGGGFKWGESREIAESVAEEVWYVSEQGLATAALKAFPGARIVADVSPLDSDEERELSQLQARAVDAAAEAGHPEVIPKLDSPLAVFDLDRLGLLTAEERSRFGELSSKAADRIGCRCAVVAVPVEASPPEGVVGTVGGF